PMISTALVPCRSWKESRLLKAAKSTDPSLLNGVISATNEPVIFCLGMSFNLRGSTPSPLWGGWGGGRGGGGGGGWWGRRGRASRFVNTPPPPPPAPPHKGEGKTHTLQ